jgi:hypothetical protein
MSKASLDRSKSVEGYFYWCLSCEYKDGEMCTLKWSRVRTEPCLAVSRTVDKSRSFAAIGGFPNTHPLQSSESHTITVAYLSGTPLHVTLPIMPAIAAIEKLGWFSISENKQEDSTTAKKAGVAASYVATL